MPKKPINKAPRAAPLSPALEALVPLMSPEELETGILMRPERVNPGRSWTPSEIAQAVRLELEALSAPDDTPPS